MNTITFKDKYIHINIQMLKMHKDFKKSVPFREGRMNVNDFKTRYKWGYKYVCAIN